MTVAEGEADRLLSRQRAFESVRDGVWMERIGAGLAYRRALREIDERVAASRRARDDAVVAAVDGGGSYREVGRALGLSHSRVQQIVRAARAAGGRPPELP